METDGASTSETYTTALTHYTETELSSDHAEVQPSAGMPQNQRLMKSNPAPFASSSLRLQTISHQSFTPQEMATQKAKFLAMKGMNEEIARHLPSGHKPGVVRGFEEVRVLCEDSWAMIACCAVNDNPLDRSCSFLGPDDTPYEGGILFIRWALLNPYPSAPR